MEKERVIKCISEKELDYRESLQNFLEIYQGFVEKLHQEYIDRTDDSREKYMIVKLYDWLESEGYYLFYSTVEQLNNDANDKIKGFIELYSFLLSCSEQDILKLVDQLFFIPGQFAKEFMQGQRTLIGECKSNIVDIGKTYEIKYTFSNKGAFEEAPCFFRRIRYEY